MHKIIQIRNNIVIGVSIIHQEVEAVSDKNSDILLYIVDLTTEVFIDYVIQESQSGISAIRTDTGDRVFLTITPNQ